MICTEDLEGMWKEETLPDPKHVADKYIQLQQYRKCVIRALMFLEDCLGKTLLSTLGSWNSSTHVVCTVQLVMIAWHSCRQKDEMESIENVL